MIRRRRIRHALLIGLDRWVVGQRTLIHDVHRWVTARTETENRTRSIALRHGAVVSGGILTVAVGGWLVAVAGASWTFAAWRCAPDPPTFEDVRREAYMRVFVSVIGDRTGVHLSELYPTLRRFDHWAQWTDEQFRALLNNLDVPVRRTMRVGDVTGRSGIRRTDVESLMTGVRVPSPPPVRSPSPVGKQAVQGVVESSESLVEPGVEDRPRAVTVVVSRPEDESHWP